jgi:DNA replication protein DnaC
VEAGYRGYFTTATDMVAAMTTAYADGTFAIKLRTYTGPSVLVIDDVGITPFDRAQSNAFFQVVNRRYILTSEDLRVAKDRSCLLLRPRSCSGRRSRGREG